MSFVTRAEVGSPAVDRRQAAAERGRSVHDSSFVPVETMWMVTEQRAVVAPESLHSSRGAAMRVDDSSTDVRSGHARAPMTRLGGAIAALLRLAPPARVSRAFTPQSPRRLCVLDRHMRDDCADRHQERDLDAARFGSPTEGRLAGDVEGIASNTPPSPLREHGSPARVTLLLIRGALGEVSARAPARISGPESARSGHSGSAPPAQRGAVTCPQPCSRSPDVEPRLGTVTSAHEPASDSARIRAG